ncbi:ATP-binding protein [Herbaspirillum lusitanum]|uniref:ATP-binding protein n=1 Tax=Herbaspirillum lusitanum TaxID=213312 RepID=UPI00058BE635|nr:ATP-binding protein [Herbaspirillum lusitanum]
MDGFKRKITQSLQAQLLFWVSLVIVVAALGGGYFSFQGAFAEAYEFQDDQLRQIAGLMEQQRPAPGFVITEITEETADPESQVIVQVMGKHGSEISVRHNEKLSLPPNLPEGIQTFQSSHHAWRLFIRDLSTGDRLVIGQRTEVRDEIAHGSGLRTVLPFLILMPVLLIVVNVLIRQMLKPVARLSSELDRRSEADLSAMDDEKVPAEIKPFTASINALLLRVEKSMEMQKRFVADAAHELRSPLTALSLQAENLAKIELPPAASERLATLRGGMQRMRTLLEQLLLMARAQATSRQVVSTVKMQDMFREVLEDLMPMAEAKKLEVEVSSADDVYFHGHHFDCIVVIKNLVDNAIRYTPEYGRLILSAHKSDRRLIIDIEDSGPGISDDDVGRIFDPFYRVLGSGESGSGLGLAIVKAILDRSAAKATVTNIRNEDGTKGGLRVRVTFPQ